MGLIAKKLGIILGISSLSAGGIAAGAYFSSIDKPQIVEKVVPDEYLNLSEDGTVLSGFSESILISDIAEKAYNTLKIPESVKRITAFAFAYMFDGISLEIETLYLNPALEVIETGAFKHCKGLKNVNFYKLQESEHHLTTIGNEVFMECGIQSDIIIPDTVTSVGSNCFNLCEQMSGKLSIPASLTNVGDKAFANLYQAQKLDISKYSEIQDWMYLYKFVFQSFGIKSSARKQIFIQLGNYSSEEWQEVLSIRQAMSLETINFGFEFLRVVPNKFLNYDDTTLFGFSGEADYEQIAKCDLLIIPNGIVTIASNAFINITHDMDNAHLQIQFNSSLMSIEENAFKDCTWIQGELKLNSAIMNIKNYAFKGCKNISGNLLIPASVLEVGEEAFADCEGICSLTIGSTTTKLGKHVFKNNTLLSLLGFSSFDKKPDWGSFESAPFDQIAPHGNIILPTNLSEQEINEYKDAAVKWGIATSEAIDNWVFTSYDPASYFNSDDLIYSQKSTLLVGLTELGEQKTDTAQNLILSDRTLSVMPNAFANKFIASETIAPSLFVELNVGLQNIGDYAFANCSRITSLSPLPTTLRTIGVRAFSNCKNIKSVLNLNPKLTSIGDEAFLNCSELVNKKLIFPSTVNYIGDRAFCNNNLESITLNGNVLKKMGSCAFDENPNLNSINLESCAYQDVAKWGYSTDSLKLSSVEGKVWVKGKSQQDWEKLLQRMGLPAGWTIEWSE